MGGGTVTVDSSALLFVCAGAFEGLYDAVFDRVTIGADKGALQPVTVVEGGRVSEKLVFHLRDWLRNEDLFAYGMSPQFLSRFDAVVLLEDLGEEELARIFLETPESGFHQTRAFFESRGVKLAISKAAVEAISRAAARQPRLGARVEGGLPPRRARPRARAGEGGPRGRPADRPPAGRTGAREPLSRDARQTGGSAGRAPEPRAARSARRRRSRRLRRRRRIITGKITRQPNRKKTRARLRRIPARLPRPPRAAPSRRR